MFRVTESSNVCGTGGMHRDTVFAKTNTEPRGMEGMVVGRVFLFFSFKFRNEVFPCTFINWYILVEDSRPDDETRM